MARSTAALAVLAGAVVLAGCVPNKSESPSPSPAPSAPAGWQERSIGDSPVQLALPEGWLAFDGADLADPDVRRQLEADFAGADTLFAQLDAQGNRAPLVFLGVDPRERGTGRFPAVVTVVVVEPALPPILLGVGADFATDAFESTFELRPTSRARTSTRRSATASGCGSRIGWSGRRADRASLPSTTGRS